jgi:signal transduction histidine kinase
MRSWSPRRLARRYYRRLAQRTPRNWAATPRECTCAWRVRHDLKGTEVQLPSSHSGTHSARAVHVLIDPIQLSSVLSNFSHELCRQLASLRAGFDLILGESQSEIAEDQRAHLLSMVSLCDDLLGFTRSALDYTAIAHGSRPLCLGSFTIGALIQEIDRQFAPIARSRRVQWETHASNPDSPVLTDASRCQQILGILVANALKYTPLGGRVRVAGVLKGEFWQLSVCDSGLGIPDSWHDRVFEPFVRLARDERSGIEGNGLGLAICRELVAQLHGTIALESSEGLGTTMNVRFPITAASTAVTAAQRT